MTMRPLQYGIMLAVMGLMTACSGPVETRISTAMPAAPEKGGTYFLSVPEGAAAPEQEAAITLLEQRLTAQGLTRTLDSESAQYVVSLGVADRLADVGYTSGNATLAIPKQKRALQSCADREYRITLVIQKVADGTDAYQGSASEYHCKAKFVDAMPLLLDAALSGFNGQTGARIEKRSGLD